MGKLTQDGGYMEYELVLAFVTTHLGQFTEITHRYFTCTIPRDLPISVLAHQLCVHLGANSWCERSEL